VVKGKLKKSDQWERCLNFPFDLKSRDLSKNHLLFERMNNGQGKPQKCKELVKRALPFCDNDKISL
jgi:hypothetical protein